MAEKVENRGRPITCRICKHKFKFSNRVEREDWHRSGFLCPSCGGIYCVLPKTERVLRLLQDDYFENNKEEKYLTEIYKVLFPYCKSMILKSFSNMITSPDLLDYYTINAISFFIEEYRKREDFKVEKSFGGLLNLKIKQAIFGKQEYNVGPESLDWEFDDGKKITYSTRREYDPFKEMEKAENVYLLWEHLVRLILGVKQYCTEFEYYIIIHNLQSFFKKGKKYTDRFFGKISDAGFGRKGKDKFQKIIEVLKDELTKSV